MARHNENAGFRCLHCARDVKPVTNGSYRNHCPFCLWSRHVDDNRPGDRLSCCRALMKPTMLRKRKKGLQLIHECVACGKVQPNIIAFNSEQDDFEALLEFMHEYSKFHH